LYFFLPVAGKNDFLFPSETQKQGAYYEEYHYDAFNNAMNLSLIKLMISNKFQQETSNRQGVPLYSGFELTGAMTGMPAAMRGAN